VKCAAALSEIANCFKLYSIDNKGYYPPMYCQNPYTLYMPSNPPVTYDPTPNGTYWMYFLARYVSHAKFGGASGTTAADVANSMNSVLWGCPNFVPVLSTIAGEQSVGGVATVYTGYGMNGFPEYTAQWPRAVDSTDLLGDTGPAGTTVDISAVSRLKTTNNWKTFTGPDNVTPGRWYKYKAYTNAADRALVGDCRAYVLEAAKATSASSFIGQVNILTIGSGQFWASNGPISPGESSYDYYRHGKYPPLASATQYSPNGGQIGYNVMFADGHVSKLLSREDGFKAARMRWPG
jgi:prepilin-type processing-associated H-X9-DG protein